MSLSDIFTDDGNSMFREGGRHRSGSSRNDSRSALFASSESSVASSLLAERSLEINHGESSTNRHQDWLSPLTGSRMTAGKLELNSNRQNWTAMPPFFDEHRSDNTRKLSVTTRRPAAAGGKKA